MGEVIESLSVSKTPEEMVKIIIATAREGFHTDHVVPVLSQFDEEIKFDLFHVPEEDDFDRAYATGNRAINSPVQGDAGQAEFEIHLDHFPEVKITITATKAAKAQGTVVAVQAEKEVYWTLLEPTWRSFTSWMHSKGQLLDAGQDSYTA